MRGVKNPFIFVIDTCLTSDLTKPRPNPRIVGFLEHNDVYVPMAVIKEHSEGRHMLDQTRFRGSDRLKREFDAFRRRRRVRDLPTDADVAEIFGELRAMFIGHYLHNSEDLHIAAAAIAKWQPIATNNTKDFLEIDRRQNLPGLYEVLHGRWVIAMRSPRPRRSGRGARRIAFRRRRR